MLTVLLRYSETTTHYARSKSSPQNTKKQEIRSSRGEKKRPKLIIHIRVKARHAEAFVSLIVKHGRDFKFLSFFKAIPVAYGIPIKANQLLALRMLASHSSHTLPPIPWKGTVANASEVQYHSALLDVMGLCSYGMRTLGWVRYIRA